jgi:hypothetical protein
VSHDLTAQNCAARILRGNRKLPCSKHLNESQRARAGINRLNLILEIFAVWEGAEKNLELIRPTRRQACTQNNSMIMGMEYESQLRYLHCHRLSAYRDRLKFFCDHAHDQDNGRGVFSRGVLLPAADIF